MSTKNPNYLKARLERRKNRLAWLGRIGLFLASCLLTTLLLVIERTPGIGGDEFVVGEPAPRTLFAPFTLTYENEEETGYLVEVELREVPYVFVLDPGKSEDARKQIDELLSKAHQIKETPVDENTPEEVELPEELPLEVSEDIFQGLLAIEDLEGFGKHLEVLTEQVLGQGVISNEDLLTLTGDDVLTITVQAKGKEDVLLIVDEILTLDSVKTVAEEVSKTLIPRDRAQRDLMLEIFSKISGANLVFDESGTKDAQKKAADQVEPVLEQVLKNELVIQRGMIVSEPQKIRLDAIQKEMEKQQAIHKFFAIGLLVFLSYLFSFFYMVLFERKTLRSFKQVLLMHVILITTVILCRVAMVVPFSSPFLMPVALASLLLALLVNPRLGILCGAVVAVLVASIVDFSTDIIVATLLSSTAGVFASIRVRRRIQFLKIGAAIGIAYFFALFAFRIYQEYPMNNALIVSLQGLANGLLITMPLAFLLLPLFEWLFDRVTDITLLELSDLNHPVLKRMIVEAPGTYHHSLVVSTLAESACESIGANALLARVGCYFHDIGKIARAEYFTENQAYQAPSRHEKLTPTMSCLVILNHVKDGIELGRKHKLKQPILDFIPQHQGTGVIYYFYKKALDQAKAGEKINVEDFRYPGPKPQSRETAVALLADSTEAASRSLKDPTPESVRQLVRKIINDKFIDGQLDECNLTLRDLHGIQESFIKNLLAIFHTRVTYPDKPEEMDKPDLFEQDQFSKFRIDS